MESEKISFVKYIDKSFNVFQQLWRFRKGDREQIFNYLFYRNHIPKMETWAMAGELAVWGLWCFAVHSMIMDDKLSYTHIPYHIFLCCWALALLLLGKIASIFVACIYLPLSLAINWAKKTKKLSNYWLLLWAWAIFCFVFSVVFGEKEIVMRQDAIDVRFVPAIWLNPRGNTLILLLGYPMLLSVTIGTLIISAFYYLYKPQTKNNEGLDADFVNNNDYLY